MKNGYLRSLTWLRAFAAFFVVVSHSVRTYEVKYSEFDEESFFLPLSFLDLGTFGVCLFFALSGCTLYLSNEKKLGTPGFYHKFFIKRFFRIWPAFAISMVIYLLFIEFFKVFYLADEDLWIAQFLHSYTFSDVMVYLSLTFNLTGPSGLFQGPYWSLPVEFQYYLLLPFCIFFMSYRLGFMIAPIIFGGVLYIVYMKKIFDVEQYEVFKLGYIFFGGVLIASFYKWRVLKISPFFSVLCFFIIISFVGLINLNWLTLSDGIPFISDKNNVYGVCALLSVFIALNMRQFESNNAVTRIIGEYGEISYSVYLFHMIFVGLSALAIVNFKIFGDSEKLIFVFLFSLIGSFIFSKFMYKYVELPCINFGRRFSGTSKSIDRDNKYPPK